MDPPTYETAVHPSSSSDGPARIGLSIPVMRELIKDNTRMAHHPKASHCDKIDVVIGKVTRPPSLDTSRNGRTRAASSAEPISADVYGCNARALYSNDATYVGMYYAAVVGYNDGGRHNHLVMLGLPQDTVEEALAWLLERTYHALTASLVAKRALVLP